MKLSVPRDDPDDMLLYIWKIVDLPSLSYNDLLYKVIFEFFLFLPDEASSFINNALKKGLLVQQKNTILKLSDELNQKFHEWQKMRKFEIKSKIVSHRKKDKTIRRIQIDNENKFNHLLKKIIDGAALNRAVAISDDDIIILNKDKKEGVLEAKIKGTKEKSYMIKINLNKKILMHNCHDFETRRAKDKKFCKHLIKLFLLLKRESEELATYFLEKIINQINEWEFCS